MIRIKTTISGWIEVLKQTVFDAHVADENAHHPQLHTLNTHTDVNAPAPLDEESLIYDENTSQWINGEARHQLAESNPSGLVDV